MSAWNVAASATRVPVIRIHHHQLDMKLRNIAPEPNGGHHSFCLPSLTRSNSDDTLSSSMDSVIRWTSNDTQPDLGSHHSYALADRVVEFTPRDLDGQMRQVDVTVDGVQRYRMKRIPRRRHCWHLLSESGELVARFRASRCFSWLELVDKNGHVTPINHQFYLGNDTIDWGCVSQPLGPIPVIRWRRRDQAMVCVSNNTVRMPALATLHSPVARLGRQSSVNAHFKMKSHAATITRSLTDTETPTGYQALTATRRPTTRTPSDLRKLDPSSMAAEKNKPQTSSPDNEALAFVIHWRQPIANDEAFERIVLCTAVIAHWKWSRRLYLVESISHSMRDPLIHWLRHNLELGPKMVPLGRLLVFHPALRSLVAYQSI